MTTSKRERSCLVLPRVRRPGRSAGIKVSRASMWCSRRGFASTERPPGDGPEGAKKEQNAVRPSGPKCSHVTP